MANCPQEGRRGARLGTSESSSIMDQHPLVCARLLLSLWLTVATAVDPDGAWWDPLTFGGCTVLAAASAAVWLRQI